jgi:hypothetical protein
MHALRLFIILFASFFSGMVNATELAPNPKPGSCAFSDLFRQYQCHMTEALKAGNDAQLVFLLKTSPHNTWIRINDLDVPDCGPSYVACAKSVTALRILLDHGFDPNLRVKKGSPAFYNVWVSHGQYLHTVFRYFLDAGMNPNLDVNSPYFPAFANLLWGQAQHCPVLGRADVIDLLVSRGAAPASSINKTNILHWTIGRYSPSASGCHLQMAQKIAETFPALLHEPDARGFLPIDYVGLQPVGNSTGTRPEYAYKCFFNSNKARKMRATRDMLINLGSRPPKTIGPDAILTCSISDDFKHYKWPGTY